MTELPTPTCATAPIGAAPRRSGAAASAVAVTQVVLVVGYPVLTTLGLAYLGARTTALLLLAVVGLGQARRLVNRSGDGRALLWMAAAIGAPLALAALTGDPRLMLAAPTLVNLALLAQFAATLLSDRPMVERFARLQVDDLTLDEIAYCRAVTKVWCVFFILNGATAALLATLAPRGWWALYTGALSYALMGALFAAEYVVRKARFGRFGRGLLDRFLSRVLRTDPEP